MKVNKNKQGAERLVLRSFFINKIILKAVLIFILGFAVSGCALIGLLLKLAPLAAAVLVEYSPPVQTEDGKILCVKSLRHVERQDGQTRIVESEYFLVMLDDNGTEITSSPLNIGQDYFEIDKFNLARTNDCVFNLSLTDERLRKAWEVKVIELQLAHRFCLTPSLH